MAQFTYYWKSPDNSRHEGEIEAESRDAAFAALRAQGIRAIKVEPKGWESGKGYRGVRKRVVFLLLLAMGLVVGAVAYFTGTRNASGDGVITVETASGQVVYSLARPFERQPIFGDRYRIENFPSNLFSSAAETYLVRFAEPGRPLVSSAYEPAEEELRACLSSPVRVASNEFTEYVDLKRIVAGIKREMGAYVAGGGTARQYIAEAVKRQKMEIAYREKADRRLGELLKAEGRDASSHAYDYWLKANAQLKSMGIYELPLPDALRAYQMDMDLDEK